MKDLAYLTEKYGPDFLAKLPMYKTAYYGRLCVGIVSVNLDKMTVLAIDETGQQLVCKVSELDDFCL